MTVFNTAPVQARAAQSAPASGTPRLVVDEVELDLGVVRQGQVYELQYVLTNTGDADLLIERVVSSCACAVAHLASNRLAAGESMTLLASLDTTALDGPQHKTIRIATNDPAQPEHELSLRATVDVPVLILPEYVRPPRGLSFHTQRSGQAIDPPITLLSGLSNVALRVLDVTLSTPHINWTQDALPSAPGGQQGVQLTFHLAADAPPGPIAATAEIKVQSVSETTTIRLPIRGVVVTDIAYRPTAIPALGVVAPGEALPFGRLTLRALRHTDPFSIRHIEAEPGFVADFEIRRPGLEYEIMLRAATDAAPGPLASTLSIFTDSPTQPIIQVPVFARISGRARLEPPICELYHTTAGARVSQIIQVISNAAGVVTITELLSDSPHVQVKPLPATRTDRAAFQVTLAPNVPSGHHDGVITIKTQSAGALRLRVLTDVTAPDDGTGQGAPGASSPANEDPAP